MGESEADAGEREVRGEEEWLGRPPTLFNKHAFLDKLRVLYQNIRIYRYVLLCKHGILYSI